MSEWNEDRSIYNGHSEVEVVIRRPIADVWKQFLQLRAWVENFDIDDLDGTPGTLGWIWRVNSKEAAAQGLPLPHYHYCKVFRLVPEQRLVLKVYSAESGSYGYRFISFDEGRFTALDRNTTKIAFSCFTELKGQAIADALAKNPNVWDDDVRQSAEGMIKNLGNLKRLLENGGAR